MATLSGYGDCETGTMPASPPPTGRGLAPAGYSERLTVPLWWWGVAALLVLLLGAEFNVRLSLPMKILTYLIFGGAAALLLVFAGAVRVGVADGTLLAGRARLPLQYAGEVRILDRAAMRALMGPQADPAAWTVHRPWVKEGLAVVVTDPDDDTPYWLISSRRPAALAAALNAARAETPPMTHTPPETGA